MIKPERSNHVKFSDANKVFDKERLVVCRPRLVERDDVGSRSARCGQEIRSAVFLVECVSDEWCVAVINNAAKGQSAAFENAVVSPQFPEAYVSSTVVECFVPESGARREWMGRTGVQVCCSSR